MRVLTAALYWINVVKGVLCGISVALVAIASFVFYVMPYRTQNCGQFALNTDHSLLITEFLLSFSNRRLHALQYVLAAALDSPQPP